MSWHLGRLCGFDLETTGTDPDTDRVVTSCVVQVGGGRDTDLTTWLANPGVDIPDGAAAVHGVTTERARAEGRPAAEVVAEVADALASAVADGVPVVAMNARFDLTMLDRECSRYGVPSLFGRGLNPIVIDPLVLDKQVDRYRRGGRKLSDLCAHYRVALESAHTAEADAVAACRVAWRIAEVYKALQGISLGELHSAQVGWARQQAESLAEYFARTSGPEKAASVRPEWPFVPAQRGGGDRYA